jgi:hypothetical protein
MRNLLLSAGVFMGWTTGALAAEPARPAPFRCEAGEIRGVPSGDGQTVVEMVCEEIKRRSGGAGSYQVDVRSLGRRIVLTAARLDDGTSITLQLDSIEETSTSAARVAEALVAKRSLAQTQRVDNLLESETRQPLSKKGSVKFAVGVGGFSPLGHGGSGAGFSIGLIYATPRFALPAMMRFGWNQRDNRGREANFSAISVGARHYFSNRDASPFAGAGFSMIRVSAHEGRYELEPTQGYFDAARLDAAPYLEAGAEILRLHRARLSLSLQVDFPLGSLKSEEFRVYSYDPSTRRSPVERVVPSQSRYVVPATLGVTLSF